MKSYFIYWSIVASSHINIPCEQSYCLSCFLANPILSIIFYFVKWCVKYYILKIYLAVFVCLSTVQSHAFLNIRDCAYIKVMHGSSFIIYLNAMSSTNNWQVRGITEDRQHQSMTQSAFDDDVVRNDVTIIYFQNLYSKRHLTQKLLFLYALGAPLFV